MSIRWRPSSAGTRLYFMQSNGGLAEAHSFGGKDAILSGPAGGIVGAARTAEMAGLDRIIGFDMGGTSTDVALYDGAFERAFETEVAGVRMRAPMMAINTVAAGGGSILHFDGARVRVGPDSAGANPGPASYRRGGPLTVTDANVCVGKVQPAHFPAIFGPGGDEPLDADTVRAKFAALAAEMGRADPREAAEGFLRVAVANMANAIKQVSVQKGHDASRFALQCFGGAGGQHACLVADELGMQTVFIHPYAGVLSAYGMGLADQAVLREQAVELPWSDAALTGARAGSRRVGRGGAGGAAAAGRRPGRRQRPPTVHLRYAGTEAALPVPLEGDVAASRQRSPRRIGRGSASRRRAGRWWPSWSRSRRSRPGETVDRGGAAGARERRAGAGRHRLDVERRPGARDAGIRADGAAGGRPAGRAGAAPRGERDDGGRAGLDGRGDGAGPRAAAPHRGDGGPGGGGRCAAGPGAAGAVQQPVHERGRADRGGAAEHLDERQHQGAAGFLLRAVRRGRATWSPTRRMCRCISARWARA